MDSPVETPPRNGRTPPARDITSGRTHGGGRRRDAHGAPRLPCVRAVQITRFGGPEVMDVVDLPDPVPADGQQLHEVIAAGVNHADTHHGLS